MSHPADPPSDGAASPAPELRTDAAASPGSSPAKRSDRRTVAVLMDSMDLFGRGRETELRQSFDAACRKFDLNLLMAYGLPLESPHPWGTAHNAVYQLMAADRVDGVVVVSSTLVTYCEPETIRRLCERYGSRPLCSIGLAVPGVPSILVDLRSGMEELIGHLVVEHGCRRLGFIGGPSDTPDAQIRLELFRETLQQRGLDYDGELVANADFVRHSGEGAVDEILDRGAKPDGVVVANDGMALGVIAALRKRGLRVPQDIPVTGFGNLAIGRLVNPPLTTLGQPLQSMAERAIALLVDQLDGRTVPACTYLPADFVTRQSCGCNRRARQPFRSEALGEAARFLRAFAVPVRRLVADCLRVREADAADEAALLVASLQAELDGQTDAFPTAIETLLSKPGDDDERYQRLQATISCLRAELREVTTVDLEDLWHDARSLVTLVNARHHAQQRSRIDEACRLWVEVQDLLSTAIDATDLSRSLAKGLQAIGIQSAFVSQCPEGQKSELEPLFCMLGGHPCQAANSRYPARELYPSEEYPGSHRHTSLVFPLAFEAQPLGVAVFECAAAVAGYDVLRSQISAALRSVGLHEEVVRRTMLHERSVQERLATAQRIQALSVLAGGVAHDLNNVLGPMVALPDLMLGELAAIDPAGCAAPELRSDLEEMKRAAARASHTVADLLTLSRQGRTSKEPLDLNHVAGASLATAPVRSAQATHRDVTVASELHPDPLVVRASEAHILRAVGNLVCNAIEAIDGSGQVLVKTGRVVVAEPTARYETIEPGDYAVIAVSDTGAGIPRSELDRLFEPFFTSKTRTDRKGSGLGLAIVHGVTKEHDGFVDVHSVLGVGSTVTLYLPRVVQKVERSVLTSHAPRACVRVLVVDDEPSQLRTARRVLSRYGYEVDTVRSGVEAYRLFAQAAASHAAQGAADALETGKSPYDVVVLDMILNESEDGVAVFERIERLFPGQKGVIASGFARTERAQIASERGLVWLAKPYTPDALGRAVHAAMAARPE
ncbi:MAG: substrate-binding domain-containing protein [Polyangiaceae bacterium]|nr:substrate-binding domain-containing protein [Polyangiaceae bacterium]